MRFCDGLLLVERFHIRNNKYKKAQKYKNFSSPIFGTRSSTDNHIFYFTSSTNQSLGFSINLHIKPYWVRFMADLINKI